MANEKIVTLENLTTYNDKIQDKITAIDDRVSVLETTQVHRQRQHPIQKSFGWAHQSQPVLEKITTQEWLEKHWDTQY